MCLIGAFVPERVLERLTWTLAGKTKATLTVGYVWVVGPLHIRLRPRNAERLCQEDFRCARQPNVHTETKAENVPSVGST